MTAAEYFHEITLYPARYPDLINDLVGSFQQEAGQNTRDNIFHNIFVQNDNYIVQQLFINLHNESSSLTQ